MVAGRLLCYSLLFAGPSCCWATRPEDQGVKLQRDEQAHDSKESEQPKHAKSDSAVRFPMPCRFTVSDSDRHPTPECAKFVSLFIACDKDVINTEIKVPGHAPMRNVGDIKAGQPIRMKICNADSDKESHENSKKVKLLGNLEGGGGGIGEAYAEEVKLKEESLPCKLSAEKVKIDDGSPGLRFSALCTEEVSETCMTTGLRETCFNITAKKAQTLRLINMKDLQPTETSAKLVGLYKGAHGLEEGLSNSVPIEAPPTEKKDDDETEPEEQKSSAVGRHLCVALPGLAAMFAAAVSFL